MKEDTFLDALSERIKKENVLREGQPEVRECTHSQKHRQGCLKCQPLNLLKRCFLRFGKFLTGLLDSSTKQQFLKGYACGKTCAESQRAGSLSEPLQSDTY